jgi:hypothetical protein
MELTDNNEQSGVWPLITYRVTVDGRLVIVTGRMTESEALEQAKTMLRETDDLIKANRRFL